ARFATAFTFQYSKRPGTPAADLPDQLPKAVVQERYDRLIEVVNEVAWDEARKQEGRVVELLIADHEGKKDGATHRLTGRARDNRLVHFVPGDHPVRPGDMVEVRVTYAAPHHLVSDDAPISYRRTRAGDAWEARAGKTEVRSVGLGMPSLGVPAPLPPAQACAI
ncbi:MAG: tRNA (N6-isopentenyl adenosine(37)-C2)-methylthiotransferase MiaB, partial [Aeromicrobium sp.]